MSVTISEYLRTNDNRLTAILGDLLMTSVFLNDTLIKVRQLDDEWWCDIFLDYTLSCNDLTQLHADLAGYWWCVSPNYGDHGYRIYVNLKDSLG